jgi:hypothetical protein
MILPINDETRIVSDCHQWTIQRSRKRTVDGKPDQVWEAQSYYPTFASAIEAVGERLVRDSDAVGFTAALAEVERIATELSQALTCVIKPTQGKES